MRPPRHDDTTNASDPRAQMKRDAFDSYLRALDVSWPASRKQLRDAHRDQALAWHPDRFSSAAQKAKAEEKLKRINRAFEELTNLVGRGQWLCERCGELREAGLCASCRTAVDEAERGARATSRRNAEAAAARAAYEAGQLAAQERARRAAQVASPRATAADGWATAAARSEVRSSSTDRSDDEAPGGRPMSRTDRRKIAGLVLFCFFLIGAAMWCDEPSTRSRASSGSQQ